MKRERNQNKGKRNELRVRKIPKKENERRLREKTNYKLGKEKNL